MDIHTHMYTQTKLITIAAHICMVLLRCGLTPVCKELVSKVLMRNNLCQLALENLLLLSLVSITRLSICVYRLTKNFYRMLNKGIVLKKGHSSMRPFTTFVM